MVRTKRNGSPTIGEPPNVLHAIQNSASLMDRVREKRPLVHHITNYVTMNDSANVALAIGGSPVMALDPLEVEEVVTKADALVINTGTLTGARIEAMILAGKEANRLGIPIVLDPLGVGISQFRHDAIQQLLREVQFAVIKGNMSEIKTLAGEKVPSHGVDAAADGTEVHAVGRQLATTCDAIIAITGKTDFVFTKEGVYTLHNGDERLTQITGTGCMATSLIGTYLGTGGDPAIAALTGLSVMGIAGETAVSDKGTGSFKTSLLDCISLMQPESLLRQIKIDFQREK